MTTIENVHPLSAEALFALIKKGFAAEIKAKLDSNLTIEYAHVFDIINISFPDVIQGTVFTLTVSDDEISISNHATDSAYNTVLLEQHLTAFLNKNCE
jgi:hypothetical protein